jgi:hypothetical protein
MSFVLDIKVGIGISELTFDSFMKDAERFFGKADNVEDMSDLEVSPIILWHYNKLGASLFFDAFTTQTFICADIHHPEASLWGKDIFTLTEKQIVELFRDKDIHLFEIEHHEWGEKRLSFDEANIDFYFERNKLVSIHFGLIK